MTQENSGQQKISWSKRYWKIEFIIVMMIWAVFALLYFTGYATEYSVSNYILDGVVVLVFLSVHVAYNAAKHRPLFQVGKRYSGNSAEDMLKYMHDRAQNESGRTIKEILVFGHTLAEVKVKVHQWIADNKIIVEEERDDFVRCRKDKKSYLKLTEPKYFEISMKADINQVTIHTEGWFIAHGIGGMEMDFSDEGVYLLVPKRQGREALENLWARLEDMSK